MTWRPLEVLLDDADAEQVAVVLEWAATGEGMLPTSEAVRAKQVFDRAVDDARRRRSNRDARGW